MMTEEEEAQWRDYHTYHPGITSEYQPNEAEVKHMIHLVAYDICSPRRLRQAAKWCEDYGVRIEKSVFECDLSEQDFKTFWTGLSRVISEGEDSLIAYRVCQSCVKEIKSAGVIERPTKRLAYIF